MTDENKKLMLEEGKFKKLCKKYKLECTVESDMPRTGRDLYIYTVTKDGEFYAGWSNERSDLSKFYLDRALYDITQTEKLFRMMEESIRRRKEKERDES